MVFDITKRSVSIATVSRVLNSSEHISEKTRRRVLEVMESSGYTPNAFARGLGLNSMRMIGVMCTDITDAYYSKAVGQIENLFRKKITIPFFAARETISKTKKVSSVSYKQEGGLGYPNRFGI